MFDWHDFFKLAERLERESEDSPLEEAILRTVIGRAYYSVFCRAQQWINSHPGRFNELSRQRGGSHERVWGLLKAHEAPQLQEVGVRGDALKRVRHRADYTPDWLGDWRIAATDAIRNAQELHDLIDRYFFQ